MLLMVIDIIHMYMYASVLHQIISGNQSNLVYTCNSAYYINIVALPGATEVMHMLARPKLTTSYHKQ